MALSSAFHGATRSIPEERLRVLSSSFCRLAAQPRCAMGVHAPQDLMPHRHGHAGNNLMLGTCVALNSSTRQQVKKRRGLQTLSTTNEWERVNDSVQTKPSKRYL